MAILMISDAATDSIEHYDQVMKQLEADGYGEPPGRSMHIAARKDNGSYLVVDVWESQEAFDRFGEVLVPLIQRAGGSMPTLQTAPVHNMVDRRR